MIFFKGSTRRSRGRNLGIVGSRSEDSNSDQRLPRSHVLRSLEILHGGSEEKKRKKKWKVVNFIKNFKL